MNLALLDLPSVAQKAVYFLTVYTLAGRIVGTTRKERNVRLVSLVLASVQRNRESEKPLGCELISLTLV